MKALSIDFRIEGGMAYPSDPELHRLALQYAEQNLAKQFNFLDVKKLLVSCEVDEEGKPLAVHGMAAIVFKPVVPVLRFTQDAAGEVLIERMRAYLEDQGWRGHDVLIHLEPGEPAAAKCPKWKKLLRMVRAQKAPHWSVTV